MPSPKRLINLDCGVTMVVTDLHGDWPLYARYRDLFLALRAQELVHTLIIAGDFIHRTRPSKLDRSLEITLDLMRLQKELGSQLVVLLGNHEFPHLYGVPLMKGDQLYTPPFEAAMGDQRTAILDFFSNLPFYVCTRAGVTICHAGAFPEAHDPDAMERLLTFSHRELLGSIAQKIPPERRPSLREKIGLLSGMSYADLARTYLAVSDPEDPRYDAYLIGFFASSHPDFRLLWSALFSPNEFQYGEGAYAQHLRSLLGDLTDRYTRQTVLVTGHIGCKNGFKTVAEGHQLRIASGAHAHPYESGRYLLFNVARPVEQAEELLNGLGCVFQVPPD